MQKMTVGHGQVLRTSAAGRNYEASRDKNAGCSFPRVCSNQAEPVPVVRRHHRVPRSREHFRSLAGTHDEQTEELGTLECADED